VPVSLVQVIGPRIRPLRIYDQTSKVYRWQPLALTAGGSFVLHQELDGKTVPSVMHDCSQEPCSVYDKAVARDVFCGLSSAPGLAAGALGADCIIGDDGFSVVLAQLRGVSGVDTFKSNGDIYLVLAQSVCNGNDEDCSGSPWERGSSAAMPQPKSAVLQWNRRDERFGNLLAVTDQTWEALTEQRVPDDQVDEHSFALRLSAGRAKGFRYLEAGGRKLLFALSQSGVLLYEFGFGKVDGLASPVALAATSSRIAARVQPSLASAVYVASDLDASVSLFMHASTGTYDNVGELQGRCLAGACLGYSSTISDNARPITGSGTLFSQQSQAGRAMHQRGLAGARTLKIMSSSTCMPAHAMGQSANGSVCHVLSLGGVRPQSHLPCATVPPLGGAAASAQAAAGPALAAAQCANVEFRVQRILDGLDVDGGARMLNVSVEPWVTSTTSSASLHDVHFVVSPASVGTADYLLTPLTAALSQAGEPVHLHIEVQAVNGAPSFEAFDVITSQTHLHQTHPSNATASILQFVFANAVSDGEQREDTLHEAASQNLTWVVNMNESSWSSESQHVFAQAPILSTVERNLHGSYTRLGVMEFGAASLLRPGTANLEVCV